YHPRPGAARDREEERERVLVLEDALEAVAADHRLRVPDLVLEGELSGRVDDLAPQGRVRAEEPLQEGGDRLPLNEGQLERGAVVHHAAERRREQVHRHRHSRSARLPAADPARSRYRWTFPVAVFGSSSTTVIQRGALNGASRARAWAWSASGRPSSTAAGRGTTNARGFSSPSPS